jgi:myosin-5
MIIPELRRDRKGNIPAVPVLNYHSAKQISSDDFGNVKQIVCGEDHTFIIDDNCNAWACGSNNKGQLGLGNAWDVEKPTLIADLKGRIKEIRTSGDVNFAITIENDLYVWPFENAKQNYKPLRLYMDKKITILTISCGKNFVMILSKQGILYSFGKSNKKGELGVGDLKPRSVPEPIYTLADSGDRITQVSCGFKHTIAKSTNGKVFTWGYVNKLLTI